jgi:UDP-glucose 4-epimerase
VPFERAEFVRADQAYSILARLVEATQVDTIVHTSVVVDSTLLPPRALHEVNVIGTLNLLAAAGAPESTVRQLVVKSSALVYGANARDPNAFTEDSPRSSPPATPVEQSLVEVEGLVRDFAVDAPETAVAVLRFSNVLGLGLETPLSRNLGRPLAPSVFGFDPLLQFVSEEDVIGALEHVVHRRLAGVFNVAGAGRLPLSEVAAVANTRLLPLPPIGTALAAAPLVRLGLIDFPPELASLLRYGRGLDTGRLQRTGFTLRHTSAGALDRFVRALRRRRQSGAPAAYVYQHDVEQFFRHSPAVIRPAGRRPG